ncbi:hypothetical protein CDD82_3637 [Ophiocordyceps australis]|uniref:Polynucleotide 5'-hydroxyl-kinase GRC3 n=1 Tax=Ophiocordyceps australis TaxID=1399860 RepID=A0A2C5ZBL8_9HYPO|nr:hypothetical protein CDD82_3637 [Ophiocordyceps australis]
MSIPGLGQIPIQPVAPSTRTICLRPTCEWRFKISPGRSVAIKLQSGTCEMDGVELAPRTAYTLSGRQARILTWHGCELEVDGRCDQDYVAEYDMTSRVNPATVWLNLHAQLAELRRAAASAPTTPGQTPGPRVLVVGAPGRGKTSVVRTLASYATRAGGQPLVVNADPSQAMLSLPGTLSAAVFATIVDIEGADHWGATPTSGPSSVPVKLPLVHYFGRQTAGQDAAFYKDLIGRLAGAVSSRLGDDAAVCSTGVLVDSMGVNPESSQELDLLGHLVDEFSTNIVVVVGSSSLAAELTKRLAGERTSLAEPIQVVPVEGVEGENTSDQGLQERAREQLIKEYFFGSARRSLSPQIQQVDFDSLVIYKVSDESATGLAREEPTSSMEHWTLTVMHASLRDAPTTVRLATVMGFVYVADVDEERRKARILAPVAGRLGDRPLIWGSWPEPFINLLG